MPENYWNQTSGILEGTKGVEMEPELESLELGLEMEPGLETAELKSVPS